MKKIVLVFFGLLTVSASVIAQQPQTPQIKGIVVDAVSKQPIASATLSLFQDGKAEVAREFGTANNGTFQVGGLSVGQYDMLIQFLGYETTVINGLNIQNTLINLDTIRLNPSSTQIGEVMITGQKALIENKIDRLVYNAEQDVTSFGGNATDLLRKVPMVSVDVDGNVSLRGDSQVKILINGKPSGAMSNNVGEALKMIPADQISSIEVITSPSAKYDGEGASGIINIITKKKLTTGVNGSLTAGIGTRQNSSNLNLNSRTGRLGVVANAGANWMWPQLTETSFLQQDLNGNTLFSQLAENETTRTGGRGTLGIDYDFNPKSLFNTTFNYNKFDMNYDGSSNTFLPGANTLKSETDQKTGNYGFDWSAGYTYKFDREKQELSIASQFSRNNSKADYNTLYQDFPTQNEWGTNQGRNDELTFLVDYSHPISKSTTLEVGAKTILRDIESDVDIRQLLANELVSNPQRSYLFQYEQDVLAAYGSVNWMINPTWQMMAGLRAENTMIKGSTPAQQINFNHDYLSFLPNVVISKTLGRMSSIKASYNQRIQRPSMFYLNPFRNTSDPVNQSQGNPTLEPETAHNFEVAYSTFHKGLVLSTSLYYRITNDVIESIYTNIPNDQGGSQPINLQTFENIGAQTSIGTNIFASYSPLRDLKLSSNLNFYSYEVKPSSNIDENLSTKSGKTYLMYRVFANASYNIANGFVAETFVILNAPRRTFQGISPHFSMWSLGVKKEILNKQATIGINVLDPFKEVKSFKTEVYTANYIQKSQFDVPFRSFGLNFSWNFGKLSMKDAPRKDRGIKNDDQKVEENNQNP